jgi:histidinol dehydrogenase
MIKIVQCDNASIPKEVEELRKKLSVTEGIVSSQSSALTEKVFGEPLTPAQVVDRIIAEVKEKGDGGVRHYARELDGAAFPGGDFESPRELMENAFEHVDGDLVEALRAAAANIVEYQSHILYRGAPPLEKDGVIRGIKVTPMERVGIYIPGGIGGETPLCSSVLMTACLARTAGVKEIVMCTPSRKDGSLSPALLAAAKIAGVDRIFKIGGVHAIAAMALGTESVPRVDKIVGPGNLFVTMAKQKLYGHVDIDFFAGPSEISILADKTANPANVAMDLFSQAEHFPGSAILMTDSEELAGRVNEEVERLLPALSRANQIAEAIASSSLIIVTPTMDRAVELSNIFCPEHLEIVTADPQETLKGIRNAGAIFMGTETPVASGDYFAGPSHVLPTGGTSRFFSGLTANDFIKTSSLIQYTKEGLSRAQKHINILAASEGLTAHAESVNIRLK